MLENVETKVTAGAAGAGGAVITANFILYLLSVWLKKPVDDSVAMFVNSVVAYVASYAVGWLAPHSDRSDLEPTVDTAPVLPPVVNPEADTQVLPELPL